MSLAGLKKNIYIYKITGKTVNTERYSEWSGTDGTAQR